MDAYDSNIYAECLGDSVVRISFDPKYYTPTRERWVDTNVFIRLASHGTMHLDFSQSQCGIVDLSYDPSIHVSNAITIEDAIQYIANNIAKDESTLLV